ncbi:unnamed protein product [Mesocestoides corti]|uniref:BEACH domain-containing protein n=2 Tax=Mesocestoides corti TaxID=53468 RepID=A0A0R3UH13_MESCO|nr:unnamed protein product [Mesocestoides corti]
MIEEDYFDIIWDCSISCPEASIQPSKWGDAFQLCTFSDAVAALCKIELSTDHDLSAAKYARELFLQSISPTKEQPVVSNYDYLMYINRLAGRVAGDPTACAILPWVTDFSAPDGGNFRDLTKTKFRLTKGEHQLDATYGSGKREWRCPGEIHAVDLPTSVTLPSPSTSLLEEKINLCSKDRSVLRGEQFLPHHLLDMMPNLAYYTYKARQTSVETLQRHVRPVYRPEEFPTSLQRLCATTPEECIPEFFTDPTIFTSIHPDMPDLQLPEWFSGSATEFLDYHRRLLECDTVSANLHHWIDLTFGYKLLGEAAVEAKNVHLELVSPKPPSNSRVTCLFSAPHPRRAMSADDLIEAYEEAAEFFVKMCSSRPPEFKKVKQITSQSSIDVLLKRDLEDLGCLIIEAAIGSAVPGVIPNLGNARGPGRLDHARHLFTTYNSLLPSGLTKAVKLLLSDSPWDLPISLLRRCVFDFPLPIIDLYRTLIGLRGCESRLNQLHFDDGPSPGTLLSVFLSEKATPHRLDCPLGVLHLLTSMLERSIGASPSCAIDGLVSRRLVQLYLAVGGKVAVEQAILPLVQRLFKLSALSQASNRICSRRFIRDCLLSVRLPVFLSTVPDLLAMSLISPCSSSVNVAPPEAHEVPLADCSQTTMDFFRAFLPDLEDGENASTSVPPVAAAQNSLLWLATTLGPLITGEHLIPSLLSALAMSYNGEEQLTVVTIGETATRLNYRIPKCPLPMPVYTSGKVLRGDTMVTGILRCLERLACLYGVEIIIRLYIPAVERAVTTALSTLRTGANRTLSAQSWDTDCEARLISSLVFLQQFITYLPARYLMDYLQEPILSVCLTGALTTAGRVDMCFPSGIRGRLALLYKVIDCVYVLGIRLGFEIMRSQMTELIQLLFALFDRSIATGMSDTFEDAKEPVDAPVCFFSPESDEDSVNTVTEPAPEPNQYARSPPKQHQTPLFVVKLDRHTSSVTVAKEKQQEPLPLSPCLSSSLTEPALTLTSADNESSSKGGAASRQQRPAVLDELQATFTPELAHMAYLPLCRLTGGSHIESSLYNIELIRNLVTQHEKYLNDRENSDAASTLLQPSDGRSKVTINTEYEAKLAASSSVSKPSMTHLHGDWIEYFRVKVESSSSSLGNCPSSSQRPLLFHGKRLVTFAGHSGSVRCITTLPNESSFVTASSDRSVQLYSMTTARSQVAASSRRRSSESGGNSHRPPTAPSTVTPPNFVFTEHRRPVFAATYLNFERLVASTDGSLILWDPATGQKVSVFLTSGGVGDNGNPSGACVYRGSCALPAPLSSICGAPAFRSTIVAGDEAGFLLVIDPRVGAGAVAAVLRLNAAIGCSTDPCPAMGRSALVIKDYRLDQLTGESSVTSPGALRCLSPRVEDNNSVLCGFSTGLVSQVDIRSGGVVATWRGHTDSVSQIFSHTSGWFSSTSADRSVAFWRLCPSAKFVTCNRTSQHLSCPQSAMTGITCAELDYNDTLLVAGPVQSPSDSSPVVVSGGLSKCLFGCYDNPSDDDTDLTFRLGGIIGLGGGQLSALAVLPYTGCLIAGTTSGLLNLFY